VTRTITSSADRRHRLEAQLGQARRDVEDLAEQVAAGDIDLATADRLGAKYRTELEAVGAELDSLSDVETTPAGIFTVRRVTGGLILIGVFVAVTLLAAGAIRPREGGFITGGGGGGVLNLDEVTNDQIEAVIAANPDNPEIAAMRVALANRYFEDGDFSGALGEYLAGLDGQLAPTRRAQALGRIGWMTFLSGETTVAELYLQQALETDPRYEEGQFFYGMMLMDGFDRPCDAIPYLETVASDADIGDDVRAELEAAAAKAVAECGATG